MKIVKQSKLDVGLFNRHKNTDPSMQYRRNDSAYMDQMSDIAKSLCDPKWQFEDKASGEFKDHLEELKKLQDYQDLQSVTSGNPTLSYYASKKLVEEWLQHRYKQDGQKRDKNRQDIRNAVKEAAEATKKLEDSMLYLFGPGGAVGLDRANIKVPKEQQMIIAERLLGNEFFEKIFKMIGRMRSQANHKLKTRLRGQDKMVGIKMGNDLENVLEEEYAEDEDVFFYKLATEQLMCYKHIGHSPADNGPIIFCIDESGSMHGPRNTFAKAFMYAMHMIAEKDRRPFYLIRFDDAEPITHEIKGVTDLLPVLEAFLGGGTDFNKPLMKACEIIEKNPKFEKADVIFVTDGASYVDSEVLKRILAIKQRISFKIISAIIGSRRTDTLESFSDKMFGIPNIYAADEFMNEVFEI